MALLEETQSPFPELIRSHPGVDVFAEDWLALLVYEVAVPPLEGEAVLLGHHDVWHTRLDPEDLSSDERRLRNPPVVFDILALARDEQGILVVGVLVVTPVCTLLGLKDGVESPILVESYAGTYRLEGAPLLSFYEFCFPPMRAA